VTTAGVVSTVAGAAQAVGSADGAGAAARFYEPTAIAVDAAGDLFVADSSNCTIRKITPTGTVSTLAGSPGVTGSADGVGNAARFSLPLGVAVDPAGNIYVADYANATIRRITPSGVVTTVGGIAGQTGDVDGTGSLVQFNSPAGVAVDGAGVLYIADAGDDLVRMGSPVAVFPIAVAASPQNETVSAGQEASFAAAASSAANLSYRWQIWPVGGQGWSDLSDGGMYQGTATPTLSVGPATAGLGGAQFRCVVRNAGVTTATGAATLDVVYLAETEQSSSTGFIAGRPAAFAAGFIGYPAPNYQWQESTDGGYSWTNLADGNGLNGSATSTLGLTAVATSLSGVQFRALVSNAAGSQTSTPVTMAVFSQPTADTVTFDFSAVAGSYLADGSANGIGAAAQFSQPSAIGADAAGNLYVVDGGDSANSVRKIAPDGTVTTLAGTPGLSGYLDGPAASALFGSIGGIAVDPAGDVYVSDNGSMTIRKISALGTVTTIAGTPFLAGYQDGIGKTAEFSSPKGLALDSSGNLFVADSLNYVVRKVTPGGAVTTFAGNGSAGSSDGIPGQFSVIYGLAIDQAGNVYVADYGNATIRKITPGGNVVTLAGTTGVLGHVDGAGAAAEFGFLSQLASDGAGNLYATDSYAGQNTGFNYASVRMITAAGVVTTLTGLVGNTVHSSSSYGNGIASTALFAGPAGVAVDPAGNLYVTDDGFVAKGFPTPIGPIPIMPVIVTQPTTQTLTAGSSGTLSVLATGEPAFAYQWLFDGSPIAGANAPSLTLSQVGTTQAGAYSVEVMDGAGMATSASVDVAVTSAARLTNLSARAWIAPKVNPANVLIGGFGITGDTPKSLLIRAVGPGLESLNVQGFLPNPTLTFHSGSFTGPILTGWDQSLATVFAELGAFQLAVGSADVAVLQTTGAGSYTEVLTPADNSTSGIALAEIYDADQGTPVSRLVNLSARAWVGTGSQVLIGGFAVAGSSSETVLIRAVGPSLQNLNITNYLPNPSVQIFDDNPTQRPDGPQLIASTGNGAVPIPGPSPVSAGFQPATADLMTRLGAFQLNSGSTDRALVVTLPPGSYTVMIQGIFGETGVALLELYEVLPP